MKVLIAGSRDLVEDALLERIIASCHWEITEVVSGMEPTGIDACGVRWAKKNGVPVKELPADWNKYAARPGSGRSNPAGLIRNKDLGAYCDAAIIIWTGKTPGSRDMLAIMRGYPMKPTIEHVVDAPMLVF